MAFLLQILTKPDGAVGCPNVIVIEKKCLLTIQNISWRLNMISVLKHPINDQRSSNYNVYNIQFRIISKLYPDETEGQYHTCKAERMCDNIKAYIGGKHWKGWILRKCLRINPFSLCKNFRGSSFKMKILENLPY